MNNDIVTERDMQGKIIEALGTAGVSHCDVTVPAGEQWRIVHGFFSHNDATARTGYWSFILLGEAERPMGDTATLAQNVRRQIYEEIKCADCIVLNPGDLIRINLAAITAGCVVTLTFRIDIRYGMV
jgi:hypothetical protein